MLPLFFRERSGEKLLPWTKGKAMGIGFEESNMTTRQLLIHLKQAFSIRSALVMVLLAIVVKIGIELHTAISTVYYIQELGWDDSEFSAARGQIELFTLAGCFLGGFLADRIGHKKIAYISAILFGISYVIFTLNPHLLENKFAIAVFFDAEGALFGALSVSLFAMCMDITLPVVAATQFTAYMAMMNLSATAGKFMSDFFYKNMGYNNSLLFWGIFQIVAIPILLLFIDPHQRKKLSAA